MELALVRQKIHHGAFGSGLGPHSQGQLPLPPEQPAAHFLQVETKPSTALGPPPDLDHVGAHRTAKPRPALRIDSSSVSAHAVFYLQT